jgi:hypothetical protein
MIKLTNILNAALQDKSAMTVKLIIFPVAVVALINACLRKSLLSKAVSPAIIKISDILSISDSLVIKNSLILLLNDHTFWIFTLVRVEKVL